MNFINFITKGYQLDFVIPGKSPLLASSLKQIRHKPKSRIKPWLRPQRQQRLITRVENFGFLFALAINAFLAININLQPIAFSSQLIGSTLQATS